ncbi:MAG: LuxR C-terminal-related transcriptional regulator [Pseudonocardia sp.]
MREPRAHRPALDAVAAADALRAEVLRLIARGCTTREVARALRITPKTADNHIQAIYGEAGVRSRAAAILFAMRHGLVDALDG